jgi:hypothetical protein
MRIDRNGLLPPPPHRALEPTRVEEEWLLVLTGTPTLRDPEGEHELAPGENRPRQRAEDVAAPGRPRPEHHLVKVETLMVLVENERVRTGARAGIARRRRVLLGDAGDDLADDEGGDGGDAQDDRGRWRLRRFSPT